MISDQFTVYSLQFTVCNLQFAVPFFNSTSIYIDRAEGAEGDREEGSKEEWVERKEE